MFSLPFFKKHKESNKFLTLEINSDSVRVIAFYAEETTCKVVGYGEGTLEEGAVRSGKIVDRDKVEEGIRNAVEKATSDSEETIDNVIVGVAEDNCIGITTTIRSKRATKDVIKQEEIKDIEERSIQAAFNQAQSEYMTIKGTFDEEIEIITSSNVYTKIDEKKTTALVGEKAHVIEIATFNAFTPEKHLKDIQSICKNTKLNLIAVGPKFYSLTQCIKTTDLEKNDFVLIEIGTDTTNVAIIFGGGIVATKCLELGYNQFVQTISNKMGLTSRESDKVLASYCSGKLTEEESVVVQKCIMDGLDIWIEGVELMFNEFTEVKTFAPKVYVTGKGATIPDVMTYLKDKPWARSIPFKDLPEIQKLEFTDIQKITDSTGKINTTAWLPLTTLSIIYLEIQK